MTPTDHPELAELEQFLAGTLKVSERIRILLHLLSGCESCLDQIRPAGDDDLGPEERCDYPDKEPEYDWAIDQALESTLRSWCALQEERGDETWQSKLASVNLLISESRELRYRDPRRMVEKAKLAVLSAQQLSAPLHQRNLVIDCQAEAWAELGNAYRVADDLKRAEQALNQATVLWEQGTGDPLLLAQITNLCASLCCDQRRFPIAFELLNQSLRIYEEQGDQHMVGRSLITMSYFASCIGEPEQARQHLIQGLPFIDSERDASLRPIALKNLILYMVESGRLVEAKQFYEQLKQENALPTDPLNQLKLLWIEGKILLGLDEPFDAEQLFWTVRQGFLENDLLYEAGLASLDIAIAQIDQNNIESAEIVLKEAYQTFAALRIDREAVAAVLLLARISL
jgi:tetratricopeptide (TPR) repeat protein